MPSSYRLFVGALVAITILNLVLFLQQRRGGGGRREDNRWLEFAGDGAETKLESVEGKSDSIWLSATYRLLHQLNDAEHLFLLDPALLARVVGKEAIGELQWRYNFTSPPSASQNSVTLGMFAHKMVSACQNVQNFQLILIIFVTSLELSSPREVSQPS